MQICWNKRRRLYKKRVQLPQDLCGTPTWPPLHCFGTPIWPPLHCFGTPTWPPLHCFGTPIWPPWRHVKKHSINARSSQSMIIGIDLSIDESIKIGKSDLIDIDCIDQSVEKDDTLDLSWFLPTSSICIARYISGAPNVNFRKISVRKTIWDLEFSEHLF